MMSDRIFSVARKASSPSNPVAAAEPLRLPMRLTVPPREEEEAGRTGDFKSTRLHTLAQGLEDDSSTDAFTPLRNASSCSRLRACLRATFRVVGRVWGRGMA